MTLTAQEHDQIRLHVGIHSGWRRIERDAHHGLVASRTFKDRLEPLPSYQKEIDGAGKAFQFLSSPLLHDLNSMIMMLNVWEHDLPRAPMMALREKIEAMELWITSHGGRP